MTGARASVAALTVALALVGSALTGCTADQVAPPDAAPDETGVSIEATGLVSNELADHVVGLVDPRWVTEVHENEDGDAGVGGAGDADHSERQWTVGRWVGVTAEAPQRALTDDLVAALVAEGWELRTDEPSVDGGRRAGLVGPAGDAEGYSITVIGGPDDSPLRSVDFQVNGPVVSTT